MQCDPGRHQQSRTGKHVRPPSNMYIARIDELSDEAAGPEEGRADPQERGSAGGAPRREETPRKRGRTARGGRRGCPRGVGEEDPHGGGPRLFDPEVEVEC